MSLRNVVTVLQTPETLIAFRLISLTTILSMEFMELDVSTLCEDSQEYELDADWVYKRNFILFLLSAK
jgi:hypothetical protein